MASNSNKLPAPRGASGAPQRSSKAPTPLSSNELGTYTRAERKGAQKGHSAPKQEKARIGVSGDQAKAMWQNYDSGIQKLIKAQGTPDYDTLSSALDAQAAEIHQKVSPRMAEYAKGLKVAQINAASGNRQMGTHAESLKKAGMDFITRGAQYQDQQRTRAANGEDVRGERRTQGLRERQAQTKRRVTNEQQGR